MSPAGRRAGTDSRRRGQKQVPRSARDDGIRVDKVHAQRISVALRKWFRANGRDLPWRKTRDSYEVLISELMLQQTQVSRVITRYGEFLETFPSLGDVARARPKRVMEAWSGLGYYARARNLHKLARTLTDESGETASELPSEPQALRALPGIGAYTAGAVASFAYEKRAPLVDTNVGRVIARVFAPRVNPKSSRGSKVVWQIAKEILPRTGRASWTHNQALMELGALVCTARVARCSECPISRMCPSSTDSDVPQRAAPARDAGTRSLRSGRGVSESELSRHRR